MKFLMKFTQSRHPGQQPKAVQDDSLTLVAAPMAGISSPIFRLLCQESGATMTFTEMVSSKGLMMANKKTFSLLQRHPLEDRSGAQIFGNDPDEMALAARAVEKAGFSLVDINMGCPVRKIVTTGAGAALMRDTTRAAAIVEAVRQAVSIPVTVKIRSGWDKQSINAVALALRLETAGADAVTVHPRTRSQGYAGKADWTIIADVTAACRIPVIGNGDVKDGRSAVQMKEETRCHGVMVGRATLGKPWIFNEIGRFLLSGHRPDSHGRPGPSQRQKYTIFLRHFRGILHETGISGGIRKFRSQAAWYTRGYVGAGAARRQIMSAGSVRKIREIVKKLFLPEKGRTE